jgi:5-methylcytosine-specific restriction endonuclease McrA
MADPTFRAIRDCRQCGVAFETPVKNGFICSDACRRERAVLRKRAERNKVRGGPPVIGVRPHQRTFLCSHCGGQFLRSTDRPPKEREFCSNRCWHSARAKMPKMPRDDSLVQLALAKRRASASFRRSVVRNARKLGEKFDPFEVFERDGWCCYICGTSTPRELRGAPVPNAPELDHVVPISRGGGHTRANTACACRACNKRKHAKPLHEVMKPAA